MDIPTKVTLIVNKYSNVCKILKIDSKLLKNVDVDKEKVYCGIDNRGFTIELPEVNYMTGNVDYCKYTRPGCVPIIIGHPKIKKQGHVIYLPYWGAFKLACRITSDGNRGAGTFRAIIEEGRLNGFIPEGEETPMELEEISVQEVIHRGMRKSSFQVGHEYLFLTNKLRVVYLGKVDNTVPSKYSPAGFPNYLHEGKFDSGLAMGVNLFLPSKYVIDNRITNISGWIKEQPDDKKLEMIEQIETPYGKRSNIFDCEQDLCKKDGQVSDIIKREAMLLSHKSFRCLFISPDLVKADAKQSNKVLGTIISKMAEYIKLYAPAITEQELGDVNNTNQQYYIRCIQELLVGGYVTDNSPETLANIWKRCLKK